MNTQYQNFGEFLQRKRTEKQITLRKMAEMIGITAPYLTDIEKDRRNPPEMEKLELISQILMLNDEDKTTMYDLAGKKRNSVAPDLPVDVEWGEGGLLHAASMEEADCVITAVVGMLGLKPTLEAIRRKKRIGLANKETLVCAGELVMAEAKQYGAEIVPVDSEHSAIFQCLMGAGEKREIRRLILTCSGGPFFGKSAEELESVTKADALRHPNWKMGPKITIDCATLMNKGLEVIEAMRLYGLPVEQVDVLIHRQSIVHSMVEFVDGAVMAQLGTPDMRLPIQLAMTYPERLPSPVDRLDLTACSALTFVEPDLEAFPCLGLARECARKGGNSCAAMNGANEEAVAMFLRDEIGFYDIYRLVRKAVDEIPFQASPTLEDILETDRLARLSVKNNV